MKMNLLLRRLQPNQLNEINLVEMLVVMAQPAEVFTLIDQSTGAVPENLSLKREGKDLLVEVDGEVVVRIMNFCAEEMNSTFSLDGSFSPEAEMAVKSDFAISEDSDGGIVWTAEQPVNQTTDQTEGSGSSWGWWLAGGLGLAGAAGLAAGGGGGGGGGDDGGGSGPTVQTVISGSIVGGPVVSGHGLTARVYGSNGQLLGTATVNTNGSYSFTINGGYSGPVLVQVSDSSPGADYMDEGTGTAKDLSVDLRAVSTVSGNGTYTVNVNTLTELAVRELGLTSGDGGGSSTNIGQITGSQISTANSNIAAAFGLDGTNPTTANVATTINANGSANAGANAYGQILAAISGMEAAGNATTGTVLAQLSGGINNGNMSDALKGALVEGAREANADDSQIGDLLDYVSVSAPGLTLVSDTGRSGTDGITNVGTVTVTGLEAGATWQYSTNGGSTWITGTGTAFTLAPGTYGIGNVQVRQTNAADDTSSAGSNAGAIIVDTTAPAINALVVSGNNVVDGSDILNAVAFNGTTTGVENGQTVSLNIGGVAATAIVSGNTFSGTVNLSAVADGRNIATTATVSDVAGNNAGQYTGSFDKDLNAPTITSLVVSADNFVNGSDTPGAVAYNGTVTNVENGQTVSLTIGGIATTAIVSGNAFNGTVNLSTVADRNGLSITADVSDAAGNPAPRFSGSFDKDTTNPSAPGLALNNDTGSSGTDGVTSDGRINVTGLEAGATWQYSTNGGSTWTNGTGNSFTLSAGTFAAGAVRARQTDAAGNTGTAGSIAGAVIVDTSAPSINTFSISTDNLVTGNDSLGAVAYSGTTTGVENGRAVSLNIGGVVTTAVVIANAFSGTINISALADGTGLAVTADVSNDVGNPAPRFNGTFNKDTAAPIINTLVVSGDNIVSGSDTLTAVAYSGTTTGVENGQTVTLSIAGVTTTTTVSGNTFNGTVNLAGLADGSGIAKTANVSDSAGNPATQFSGTFSKDTTSPIIDTFVVSTDDVVNGSDTLASVSYSGTTSNVENGRTVTINIGGIATTAVVNANAFSGTVNLSAVADANNIAMTANVSDAAGNPAPQFNGTFDKDIIAPQVQSFSSSTANGNYNAGDVINITATTIEAIKSGNTINVTLDTGDSVTLTAPANGTTLTGSYTVGAGDASSDLTISSFTIGTVQDLAGNAMTSTALPATNIDDGSAIVVDTTAPVVQSFTSSTANGSYNQGDTINITATTSEVIKSGNTISVTLDTGDSVTLTAPSNGTTLTGSYTVGAGDTSSDLAVSSFTIGTVQDLAGNAMTSTVLPATNIDDGSAIVVDGTAPAVQSFTSSTANGSYNQGDTINITATTSEAIKSGNTISVTLDTGDSVTLTAPSDGTTLTGSYTVGAGDASSDLTVSSFTVGTVQDLAGNAMTSTALPATNIDDGSAIVVDTTAPVVQSFTSSTANGSYNQGDTINITATTSEVIKSGNTISVTLDTGDSVTLTAPSNGTTLTGSYTVGAGDTSSDLAVSSFTIGTVQDLAGNAMTSTVLPATNIDDGSAIVVDGTAPAVQSFTSSTANGSYNQGDTINITATTSEAIKSGNTITVTLDTGDAVTLTAPSNGTTLTGSYTVGAGDTSSDLTVSSFTVGTVEDLAGNGMTSTALPATNINNGSNIVVDSTAPVVQSFTSSTGNGAYGVGDTINITATTSEAIKSGNTISVTLDTGDSVTLTAPSNGTTLTGSYTVGAGDTSSDLAVSSFTIGTVEDLAGNAMTSTVLPATNIDDGSAIVIETTAPVVQSFTSSTANGSYNQGDTINITATTSEAIKSGNTISVTLDTGDSVTLTAPSNGTTLTGSYTVGAGDTSSDLAVSSFTTGTVEDLAGNAMTSTALPATNIDDGSNIVVDGTAPVVQSFTSSTGNGTYGVGDTINITATTSEAIKSGNTISVSLDTGDSVTLTAPSNGTSLTGSYTVGAGDTSSDLAVSSFTIGTVEDLAGNAMTSTVLPATNIDDGSNIVVDTPYTGTDAVVTGAGIFADEDSNGVKDLGETNELTGAELSAWLTGGDRVIEFDGAPGGLDLTGFGAGDKIEISQTFFNTVHSGNWAHYNYYGPNTGTVAPVATLSSGRFWTGISTGAKGVSTKITNNNLYYGGSASPFANMLASNVGNLFQTQIIFVG